MKIRKWFKKATEFVIMATIAFFAGWLITLFVFMLIICTRVLAPEVFGG